MLSPLYGKTIQMNGTVLGFSELDAFEVIPVDDTDASSLFAYLQSTEEPEIGFLVTNPFDFVPSFEVELAESDKAWLEAEQPEDVAVLSIVTIADPFYRSTINLLAPLIINTKNLRGRQIVLPPESSYTTKTLFLSPPKESGGEV